MKKNFLYNQVAIIVALFLIFIINPAFSQQNGNMDKKSEMKQNMSDMPHSGMMHMNKQSMMSMKELVKQMNQMVQHTNNMMQSMQSMQNNNQHMQGMMMNKPKQQNMMNMTSQMNMMAQDMHQITAEMQNIMLDKNVMKYPGMKQTMKKLHNGLNGITIAMKGMINNIEKIEKPQTAQANKSAMK